MADIIDTEDIDKDTVTEELLQEQFSTHYKIITEKAVSLKKSFVTSINGSKSLKLAVGLQDNSIEVYELNASSLSQVCRLSGHGQTVTEVVFNPKEDHLVYSSGCDGLVKLWDIRKSGSCAQEFKDEEGPDLKPYECMDISCNGRVLCAGSQLVKSDAYLVFWDPRQTKPLGGYWNSHTDDITQVKFHPENSEILATGALDSLLNVFNVVEATEDDALTYSLNVENSIEKISWLDRKRVACVTQSNDLQVWDSESGDIIKSYSRDKIARSIKRSKEDDCYVVDAFTSVDDTTVVLAGSNGGTGDCLRSVTMMEKKLQPCTNFRDNKQIVRCCWYEKDRDILVTTGESGILTMWSQGVPGAEGGGAASGSRQLASRQDTLRANRHKPY